MTGPFSHLLYLMQGRKKRKEKKKELNIVMITFSSAAFKIFASIRVDTASIQPQPELLAN